MVSNIFIFPNIWDNPSHWLIFFRGVGQPPTRTKCRICHVCPGPEKRGENQCRNPSWKYWKVVRSPSISDLFHSVLCIMYVWLCVWACIILHIYILLLHIIYIYHLYLSICILYIYIYILCARTCFFDNTCIHIVPETYQRRLWLRVGLAGWNSQGVQEMTSSM